MKYTEWQHLRSRLNHDRLKNWLMPALSKLQRMAKGQITDPQFPAEFLGKLGREWPDMVDGFDALAETFRTAMSTAGYFDDDPLSSLPDRDIEWMKEVTHHLWMTSFPVDDLVRKLRFALREACSTYEALTKALEPTVTMHMTPDSSELSEGIEAFRLSCKTLGDAVSQFPSKPEFSKCQND